jgi:hypothetical protein
MGSVGAGVANYATQTTTTSATSRVLSKVCITTSQGTRKQTLPTEAFVALAHSLCLWHFEVAEAEVTMAAMQAALAGTGAGAASETASTVSGPTSLQLLQHQRLTNLHQPFFCRLRVFSIMLKFSVAMLFLPRLNPYILTQLHLTAIADGSQAAAMLQPRRLLRNYAA